MISNTWNNIINWFSDKSERSKLIRSFNESARDAFVIGVAPTLLKSSISKGESSYKHQFSNWLNTGFRIQVFTGKHLTKDEILQIGNVILADDILVRRLVVLGWDTFEVHGDIGNYGFKWQLRDYIILPKLNENE